MLLRCMPDLVKLSLDIFIDYQIFLPALFPSHATSPIQHVRTLEAFLQHGELAFPPGPANSVVEDAQGYFPRSRMRHITENSLQPCLFRFHELIESTYPPCRLEDLRIFVLHGPACSKVLRELCRQFLSSVLQTHFEGKDDSLRSCSDQSLIADHMTSYTLY